MPTTRPGVILTLICLPVFIGALDLTIISAVLPAVIADLKIPAQTGLDDAAWAVNGYLLAYAASMTFMGRVSDIWGRKRVYLLCLIIFFAGSWLAAASGGAPAQLMGRITRLIFGGRPDAGQMALYALIAGRVEAIVMASDRAEILSTARVEGEIRARRLTMVEGALVNGSMVAGPPAAHASRLELIQEAVRWEEARRFPMDEGSGAGG